MFLGSIFVAAPRQNPHVKSVANAKLVVIINIVLTKYLYIKSYSNIDYYIGNAES